MSLSISHISSRFHVTFIGPNSGPYEEMMFLYVAELEALGGLVTKENNKLHDDAINLVFGSYYLQDVFRHHHPNLDWYSPFLHQLIKNPDNIIFCNFEQVKAGSGIFGSAHLELLQRSFIFDFSEFNVSGFKQLGFNNVALVHPLYSPFLEKKQSNQNENIDILFTGGMTPHRQSMIDKIQQETGKTISYFHYNLWGEQLHEKILNSKIILNIKGHPSTRSFETLRCLFPLSNNKIIVSEISDETEIHPAFKNNIISGKADELPSLCKQVLNNENRFKEITEQQFKQTSFRKELEKGLQAFNIYRNDKTIVHQWSLNSPTHIIFGPQQDGLWNHEYLHIDAEASTGIDFIWNPDDAFPCNQSIKTLRFGKITIEKHTINKIEVNLFLARTRNLASCMKTLLDLLKPNGEISFFLPCGNEAWDLPYAVRSFSVNSLSPFLGLEVKKMGWKDYTFEQTHVSYVPTTYGTKRLVELQNDIPTWIENPGTVKYISIKLIKKALPQDYHPYDLDYSARYVD